MKIDPDILSIHRGLLLFTRVKVWKHRISFARLGTFTRSGGPPLHRISSGEAYAEPFHVSQRGRSSTRAAQRYSRASCSERSGLAMPTAHTPNGLRRARALRESTARVLLIPTPNRRDCRPALPRIRRRSYQAAR